MSDALPSIVRPNGKPYCPRKVAAFPVENRDEELRIVVLGTHDVERAQVLADQAYRAWGDRGFAMVAPRRVWWRDSFECGQRRWVDDETTGRAGVFFAEIVERSVPQDGQQ